MQTSQQINALKREDFRLIRLKHMVWYSYKHKDIEICIEFCMDGFDVACYDKYGELIHNKYCTKEGDYYSDDPKYVYLRLKPTWAKALVAANQLFHKYHDHVAVEKVAPPPKKKKKAKAIKEDKPYEA